MSTISRWVAAGCKHGDQVDHAAHDKFLDFVRDERPEYLIDLGDAFDFAALREKASETDRNVPLSPDVQQGLENFRQAAKAAPRAQKVWLQGNHDQRIYRLAENTTSAEKRFLAESIIKQIEDAVKKMGWKIIPYSSRQVFKVNNLTFLHGVAHGVNACRVHAATYGDCVFVHTHAIAIDVAPRIGSPVYALNAGCLRTLEAGYARASVSNLKWAHGFAHGTFTATGHTKAVHIL